MPRRPPARDGRRLPLLPQGKRAEDPAYIEVSIFGNEDHRGFDVFARDLTEAFHEVLDIPAGNIFATFEDITAWSVNGMFIDGDLWR